MIQFIINLLHEIPVEYFRSLSLPLSSKNSNSRILNSEAQSGHYPVGKLYRRDACELRIAGSEVQKSKLRMFSPQVQILTVKISLTVRFGRLVDLDSRPTKRAASSGLLNQELKVEHS